MLMSKKETRILVENWRKLINENSIANRSSVADLNFEQLNNKILNDEQVENLAEKVKKIYDFINLKSTDKNSFIHLNNLLIKKPASKTGLDSSRFKLSRPSLLKKKYNFNVKIESKKSNPVKDIIRKLKFSEHNLAATITFAGIGATIGTMLMGISVYSDYKGAELKKAANKAVENSEIASKIGLSQKSENIMKDYIDNLYLSIEAKMQSKGPSEDYSAVKNEVRIMLVKGAIFNEILLKNGVFNLGEDKLKEIVNTKFSKFKLDDESNFEIKESIINYLVALKKVDRAIYYSSF